MERSDILRGNGHKTCFEKNPKHFPSPTEQGRVVEAKKLRRSKTKVFVHLFQKVDDSKGRAFGRTPQSAKHFICASAFSGVWTPFAREKGSKNRLQAKINLKNYPVDDF